MSTFIDAVRERVVIYDGATGTSLHARDLGPDDYGGAQLEGCPEVLNATRPDVIADLHESFFLAGADVTETNSFGGMPWVLAEYGIADRAEELARDSARIAKEVAVAHGGWVAGSLGPSTKSLPSLGWITFAEMRDGYEITARGLLDGGVDVLIIETVQDPLQAKAAVIGARRAMAHIGRQVPVQLQITIEMNGRMLTGTETGAALTALGALRPDVFGLNCATGPREMGEHLRLLSHQSPFPISCLPNAGLPSVVEGKVHYDLSPDELAEYHARFITELGVSVVGGCCGTTPEHISKVAARCRDLVPARRQPVLEPGAASLFTAVPFQQDTSFLVIGERTNAVGSKAFRDAMLADDHDACLRIATEQVREGAHVLDLCVDYVGRDGVPDMDALARKFAELVPAPLVLDSTEPQVLEAGLERIGGRALLNSANLEEGEGAGKRFDRVMSLAREHGAAVVCLLIDETGQATDADWKLRIAKRIYDLAIERYGLEPTDLFFDALTFPLVTGQEEQRKSAVATIEAIRRIKAELPGAKTVLGVSNVSWGVKPALRHVLNSIFLHECVEAGLDAAIVHAARIMPLNRIDDAHRKLCLDLIYDRRTESYDPLTELLSAFEDVQSGTLEKEDRSGWPVEERLKTRIVEGDRHGLEADLDEALVSRSALEIVNDVLLSGMKVVGELFASGEMQLPFVLQSAEAMKTAVAYLEPHMERVEGETSKGKIVLATVRGDVHDIGKNLVDIILTNNGYEVHNLGIKIALNEMVDKAQEVNADAIGMSGLLVKSTLIMRENLEELNDRGLARIPVLLGGAALTRTYVERDLREVYQGRLFYGKDAFEGLNTLDTLMEMKRTGADDPDFGRAPGGRNLPPRRSQQPADETIIVPDRSPDVEVDNPLFAPPFLGSRVEKGIALDDIVAYINETALFRNQWQYRPQKGETDAEFKDRIRPELRAELAKARTSGVLVPQVVYGYFAANGDGNDVVIWKDDTRTAEWMRFPFPRQQKPPFLCIADFVRPVGSGQPDYAAFHIVTMGAEVSEETARLFAANRYTEYLKLHGLSVEMAEALAELWHRRIREEWGFASEDGPTVAGLFRQQYRGGRYSWGYPACPDLEDNVKVAELLEADRIGVVCSPETSYQFQPEQTTSAIILHHPKAKYFVA